MFKDPFSFEGRIRRTEYGLSVIIYVFTLVCLNLVLQGSDAEFIILIVYIPLVWFMWAQGAKRCHDRGNSGWYQMIPFYGLWMLFADGDFGYNEYGKNPKYPESQEQ